MCTASQPASLPACLLTAFCLDQKKSEEKQMQIMQAGVTDPKFVAAYVSCLLLFWYKLQRTCTLCVSCFAASYL